MVQKNQKIKQSIIALLLVFGFVSCTDKEEINDWEEPDSHESIASDSVSNLSIASQLAAKKVQKVLDVLYGEDNTRGALSGKTVNACGILFGGISTTRADVDSCIFYAIPLNEGGYSIVSANDNDIVAIIPEGNITQEEVDEQILLAQRQIDYENRLYQLEDYILERKGLPLTTDETDDNYYTDLGGVVYNDRWDNESGYTVWYDGIGDTTIYTVGYSDGSYDSYVATYYVKGNDIICKTGDTTLCETDELAIIQYLENLQEVKSAPSITRAESQTQEEKTINKAIYYALLLNARRDATEKLSEMDTLNEDISVDLHSTTCGIDGKKILSYGIKQSVGNFGVHFSNGHAGCGPVAIAAIFIQQNVHPSAIDDQWTDWSLFERYCVNNTAAGCSYQYSSAGQEKFSGFLRNIASQCDAHYFDAGTAVSRNHMESFLKKYFKMYGADVEYKDSRVKKQIDRNCLEIVYGRSSGGVSGWFSQHYWVVSAYAIVKCGSKSTTLVYNNSSWGTKDGVEQDGWYYIGNRLGYRHQGKLFEPGSAK